MADPRHLVFRCGSRWYAAPVERSFEVMTFSPPTRIPGAPDYLWGVIAHRGEVIPLIDLAALADERGLKTDRAVLVRPQGGTLALVVAEVSGLAEILAPPTPMAEEGLGRYLWGPAWHEDNQVAVIDPEGLFQFLSREGPAARRG